MWDFLTVTRGGDRTAPCGTISSSKGEEATLKFEQDIGNS